MELLALTVSLVTVIPGLIAFLTLSAPSTFDSPTEIDPDATVWSNFDDLGDECAKSPIVAYKVTYDDRGVPIVHAIDRATGSKIVRFVPKGSNPIVALNDQFADRVVMSGWRFDHDSGRFDHVTKTDRDVRVALIGDDREIRIRAAIAAGFDPQIATSYAVFFVFPE